MTKKKNNPGKYPVPQYIRDEEKKKYGQHRLSWWPTKELVDDLCTRLGNGDSVLTIAKDPTFPKKVCIFDWVARAKGKARERDREKPQHPDLMSAFLRRFVVARVHRKGRSGPNAPFGQWLESPLSHQL